MERKEKVNRGRRHPVYIHMSSKNTEYSSTVMYAMLDTTVDEVADMATFDEYGVSIAH